MLLSLDSNRTTSRNIFFHWAWLLIVSCQQKLVEFVNICLGVYTAQNSWPFNSSFTFNGTFETKHNERITYHHTLILTRLWIEIIFVFSTNFFVVCFRLYRYSKLINWFSTSWRSGFNVFISLTLKLVTTHFRLLSSVNQHNERERILIHKHLSIDDCEIKNYAKLEFIITFIMTDKWR